MKTTVIAGTLALAATLVVGPALAAASPLPSYASSEETIKGTISSVDGKFKILVRDDRGFIDNVSLHDGTVINPTGLTLASGQTVTILGHSAGSTFRANEIDTPYHTDYATEAGFGYVAPYAYPYAIAPGYGYGYGYGGYGYPYYGGYYGSIGLYFGGGYGRGYYGHGGYGHGYYGGGRGYYGGGRGSYGGRGYSGRSYAGRASGFAGSSGRFGGASSSRGSFGGGASRGGGGHSHH